MGDVFPSLLVIALGIVVLYFGQRGLDRRREASLLVLAYVAHVLAAFAQVAIIRGYYQGGDAVTYHRMASLLADLVKAEPGRFLPEVWTLTVHGQPHFPVPILGVGTSTGTMFGVTTLIAIPTGSSMYAMCLVFSVLSFASCRALYQVFRDRCPPHLHRRVLLTTMALPSVVFWTSGIVKESVAVAGFGWMVFGLHRMAQRRWVQGLVTLTPGFVVVALIKGYVVGAFFVASAVFLYWSRAIGVRGNVRIRPLYIVLLGGLAIGGVLALGRVFPRYSLDGIVEETAHLQEVGSQVGGGSTYSLGAGSQSLAAQILLAPVALLTALFRPLPFEVTGFTAAINVLETTFLTGWLVVTLARERWRTLLHRVTSSPLLMFSVTFIVLFGIGVGLASTNLGTLSRYRAPLMPLFASLIAILHGWVPAEERATAVARRPIPVRRRGVP
ncbi:MAG: hypothetical protein H6719_02830 [Sandaracinaceae bacterium]|nr:hypothetical protein [Sandaracinaceae bacterium]